jgi:hypothetical protein
MPTFQLDECLNDPEFAQECEDDSNAKNIPGVAVRLFPRRLRGEDDDVVLRESLQLDGAILTKDRRIARDWIAAIPNQHPGIIIIANAPGNAATITVSIVKKILSNFKKAFPQWHALSFRNSVLEITQIGIEIWRASDNILLPSGYIQFDSNERETILIGKLASNAK